MNQLIPVTPSVQLKAGHAVTTSLAIAEAFGKQHKNVLQTVQMLDCSEEFRQLNFKLAKYNDAQGKPRDMYEVSRDGFLFVGMGFTGATASAMKEAYINAFNAMEARLAANIPRPGQVEALRLDLAQENGDLKDALREQAALIDDLKDELLDVYRSRSPVRKVREKIVYKVPTAALELMVEYRIPRDRIAAVSGLTRLCLRQHIHNAREAGRLQ